MKIIVNQKVDKKPHTKGFPLSVCYRSFVSQLLFTMEQKLFHHRCKLRTSLKKLVPNLHDS